MALKLEIIISTMHRDSLNFLKSMFTEIPSGVDLLVINQTTPDQTIDNQNLPDHIRVINSFEKGLSKSRNLGIRNATGDILIFADDDVKYTPNFERVISEAHRSFPEPVLIFPIADNQGNPVGEYQLENKLLTNFDRIYSPQISVKKSFLSNTGIRFNENFGLGARFPDSENFVFLKDVAKQGGKVRYVPSKPVAIHEEMNTSWFLERDEIFETRLVLYKKYKPQWVFYYFIKTLFFLWRTGRIFLPDIPRKWKIYRKVKKYQL